MTARNASCSCGQLRVACEGEPSRISVCHCYACQQRTGSAFGVQARWSAEKVQIQGSSKEWIRVGDSGNRVRFHFCPTCGSTVFWRIEASPELVAVPVGAFADTTFPAPLISVYDERKHAWLELSGDMEHMD